MRAKYLLTTIGVLSLSIAGNVQADDVYVNLSVLDNLQENSSPAINQGPLFPVISASDSKAKPAKKTQSRPNKKKVKKAAKIELSKKEEIKIETKPEIKETVSPQVKPSEPKEEEIKQPLEKGPFKVAPQEPKVDSVQAAPSVPVISQTMAPVDKENNTTAKTNTNIIEAEPKTPAETVAPSNNELSEVKTQSVQKEEKASNTESGSAIEKALNNMVEQEVSTQKQTVVSQPSLLVEAKKEISTPVIVSEIYFAAEDDELSSENKTQIDSIIKTFENAKENKIAIYSFNVDDGNDSFRKKRISLNRAIAVRSYLLGQGYKNFSIKVVNLDEANGKENSVKIEELK